MVNYTAKYTKIDSGYMGQLVEWPEVITEGHDLEECRSMLKDALKEMILAYKQLGKEMPLGNALLEQIPVEVKNPVLPHGASSKEKAILTLGCVADQRRPLASSPDGHSSPPFRVGPLFRGGILAFSRGACRSSGVISCAIWSRTVFI